MDIINTIAKVAVAVTLCVLGFISGFFVAETQIEDYSQFSVERVTNFVVGKLTFCRLTEMERLIVCPAVRQYETLPTGGSVTTYSCDRFINFIEMSELTKESKKFVKSKMQDIEKFLDSKVEEHCKTKKSMVYKIEKGIKGVLGAPR
jgi:hypothetical protein